MPDPGLKLPSSKEALLTLMWDTLGFRPTEEEMDMFWKKLTADAEKESFSPAVCRAMARFYTGLADAKEQKPPLAPRCNEVVNGHLCQLAEDHEEDCGPLFVAEKEVQGG